MLEKFKQYISLTDMAEICDDAQASIAAQRLHRELMEAMFLFRNYEPDVIMFSRYLRWIRENINVIVSIEPDKDDPYCLEVTLIGGCKVWFDNSDKDPRNKPYFWWGYEGPILFSDQSFDDYTPAQGIELNDVDFPTEEVEKIKAMGLIPVLIEDGTYHYHYVRLMGVVPSARAEVAKKGWIKVLPH